jgi:hypothetical protein
LIVDQWYNLEFPYVLSLLRRILNGLSDPDKGESEYLKRLAQKRPEREKRSVREIAGDIDKRGYQSPVEQSEVEWHGTVKPWTDHPKAGNVAKEKRGP